jgi:hypothetical protein
MATRRGVNFRITLVFGYLGLSLKHGDSMVFQLAFTNELKKPGRVDLAADALLGEMSTGAAVDSDP